MSCLVRQLSIKTIMLFSLQLCVLSDRQTRYRLILAKCLISPFHYMTGYNAFYQAGHVSVHLAVVLSSTSGQQVNPSGFGPCEKDFVRMLVPQESCRTAWLWLFCYHHFQRSTVTPLRFRTVTAFMVHTVLSQWAPPALSFICFLLSPVSWRKLPVSLISHCRSGLMGGNKIRIWNLNVMGKHSLHSLNSVILIMRTAKTN